MGNETGNVVEFKWKDEIIQWDDEQRNKIIFLNVY